MCTILCFSSKISPIFFGPPKAPLRELITFNCLTPLNNVKLNNWEKNQNNKNGIIAQGILKGLKNKGIFSKESLTLNV